MKTWSSLLLLALLSSAAFCADEPKAASEPQEPKIVHTGPMDFSIIELIAVQDDGRKKPLHTYAHENLEQIIGRSWIASQPSLKLPDGTKLEMMDMFMSMWLHTREWGEIPCVLINYKPLKDELGYDPKQKHFAANDLLNNKKFQTLVNAAVQKRHGGKEKELTDLDKEVEIVQARINLLKRLDASNFAMNIIPHPKDANGTWISLFGLAETFEPNSTLTMYHSKDRFDALIDAVKDVRDAYMKRDSAAFVEASKKFKLELVKMSPNVYPTFEALNREAEYNKTRPFGKAWYLYLSAFVLGLFSLKLRSQPLYYTVMTLFIAGLGIHVYGFVQRCLIAGRPPVSNMYESVIWVAFGAVLFGLIFELIYKSRYYVVSGAGGAFVCLVLMDLLPVFNGNAQMPGFEANIKPLQPVLRDNFWLTVHVLTITLSYAAFLLAWVLGHVTLTSHLLRPAKRQEHHELHQFIYRVMQVGVLLLTIGTILGGVWAYYSWGRFWGWDPKETWAFITLLCYLFVMHGRFTGWWGNFGLSVGSVLCFLSVVMAWYGVNFVLGSLGNGGLHSYGTGAGGEEYVVGAVVLDLIFTGVAIARYKTFKSEPAKQQALTSTDPVDQARAEFAD
ncbi:MAG TPA: cytochrome c biogenesis protein CcsA [Planctomycetota bacterium]|nr:cytochrome c biogenesis protein CcsA [Planctomycetota bacterium]